MAKKKEIIYGEAWCDGSYNPKTKVYGYGVLLKVDGKEYKSNGSGMSLSLAELGNIAGEIEGAKHAIIEAKKHKVTMLRLYYDCSAINDWANGKMRPNAMKYAKDYRKFILKARKKMEIVFVKVKSHSNVMGNDIADDLAGYTVTKTSMIINKNNDIRNKLLEGNEIDFTKHLGADIKQNINEEVQSEYNQLEADDFNWPYFDEPIVNMKNDNCIITDDNNIFVKISGIINDNSNANDKHIINICIDSFNTTLKYGNVRNNKNIVIEME